jgi:hypothetical protein
MQKIKRAYSLHFFTSRILQLTWGGGGVREMLQSRKRFHGRKSLKSTGLMNQHSHSRLGAGLFRREEERNNSLCINSLCDVTGENTTNLIKSSLACEWWEHIKLGTQSGIFCNQSGDAQWYKMRRTW